MGFKSRTTWLNGNRNLDILRAERPQEFRKTFATKRQAPWSNVCAAGAQRPAQRKFAREVSDRGGAVALSYASGAPGLCGPDLGTGSGVGGVDLHTTTDHPAERKPP